MGEFIFNNLHRELQTLHFFIDEMNVVTWETLPAGEKGSTIQFNSRQKAEDFILSYARRLGYIRRQVEESQEVSL